MKTWFQKYWFIAGLVLLFGIVLADNTGISEEIGYGFNRHKGPELAVFIIFFLSGVILDASTIHSGARDVKGLFIALFIMFVLSPLSVMPIGWLTSDVGVRIGLFLVAVMPTTLSSGVVMTGIAGGNMAHSLLITVLANGLSIVTVPFSLAVLLKFAGQETQIVIDSWSIISKIGMLVILPLVLGLVAGRFIDGDLRDRLKRKTQIVNQLLILCIIITALSQSRETILQAGTAMGLVFAFVSLFHLFLLAEGFFISHLFKIGPGGRESVIIMGGQKTLPLAVILQASLFPDLGQALVVCVIHHIVHLAMDGYLVVWLRGKRDAH